MKTIWLTRFSCLAIFLSVIAYASDARNDVAAAMRTQVRPGLKYRSTSTLTSDGKTQKIIAEVIFPDRFHLRMTDMECIILPQSTWVKRGNTGWTKVPMDMSALIKQYTPEAIEETVKGISDVQYVGEEPILGQVAKLYTYTFNSTVMGVKSNGNSKIWISGDGRVLHSEVDANALGKASKIIQDIEYDDSIQLVAPQ